MKVQSSVSVVYAQKLSVSSNCFDIRKIFLPMFILRPESHSENTIMPLEVYAGNIQIALYRIKGEVVVVHSEGSFTLEVINDNAITVDVEDVRESFIAPFRHHINEL